jgi:predicted permease
MFELLSLQTGVIFLLFLIGYACRHFRVYDAVVQKGLSNLVLTVALPAKLISSAILPAGDAETGQIVTFYIICLAYFVIGLAAFTALAKAIRLEPTKKKQFGILAVFPASAFIGMPLVSALYGEKGVFFMGLFSICFSIFQYTYGIGVYTGIRRENIARLLLNPLLLASCAMGLLFLFQLRLPPLVQNTLVMLGQTSTPLSMLVVGGLVYGQPLRDIFLEKSCYLISFCRLVLIPFVAICVFWILRLDSFLAIVLTVIFSLPGSSTSVVIANKYSGDSAYSSIAVAQSMVFFLITIPCVIYILNQLWAY